jgi:hypothetical protein
MASMGGTVRLDETIDAIELSCAQGWTDGLPAVPLTLAHGRPKR